MSTNIHKFSDVSPKAQIGNNVTIGPFSLVEEDVVIGDNTVIGSNTYIANGARIGENVKVFHGAVVGVVPQDLKFGGEFSTLEVGNNTVVREFATLNRGTHETGTTKIGSDCLIMAYAHVAHDCVVEDKVILVNAVQLGGHVTIGYHATVGGSTVVHQFTHVGAHSMIGGGFRAVKDVPPFCLAGREPLACEGLNIIGLRRRGFSRETIEILDKAYTILYRRGLNFSDAVNAIEVELPQLPEIQTLVSFVRNAKRGIIRGTK